MQRFIKMLNGKVLLGCEPSDIITDHKAKNLEKEGIHIELKQLLAHKKVLDDYRVFANCNCHRDNFSARLNVKEVVGENRPTQTLFYFLE